MDADAEIVRTPMQLPTPRGRRKWIYGSAGVLIVLAAGVGVYFMERGRTTVIPAGDLYSVGYGNVVQTISTSGTLQAPTQVNLSFSGSGGILQQVDASIGESVKAGQVLARLNDSSIIPQVSQAEAAVASAQANLVQAQAKLAQTKEGPTPAAVALAKSSLVKAESALAGSQQAYKNQVAISNDRTTQEQQLVSAQNAVSEEKAAVQSAQANLQKTQLQEQATLNGGTPMDSTALQSVVKADQQAVTNAQQQLSVAQASLQNLQQNLTMAQSEYGSVTAAQVQQAYQGYQKEVSYYNQFELEFSYPNYNNPYTIPMQDANTVYQNLNSAYTALQTAQQQAQTGGSAVSQDQTALANAQSALTNAQKNLADTLPASGTNLAAQAQATVQAAQISLNQAQVQYQASLNDLNVAKAVYNDRTSAKAALDSAANLVTQNQASLQNAKASLAQTVQPVDPAAVRAAQAAVQVAQAGVTSAEAQLQTAQVNEANTVLRAPISGVITAASDQPGDLVGSGQSMFVLTAHMKNGLQVNVQVSQANIGAIKTREPITMTVPAFPSNTFTGRVLQIYPTPQVVNNVTEYTVIANVNNSGGQLRPGMTANVNIVTGQASHTLTIPAISLQSFGNIQGVYMVGTKPSQPLFKHRKKGGGFGQSSSGSGFAQSGSSSGSSGAGTFGGGRVGGNGTGQALPAGVYFQPIQIGLFGTGTVQVLKGLKPGDEILLALPGQASATGTGGAGGGGRGFGARILGG